MVSAPTQKPAPAVSYFYRMDLGISVALNQISRYTAQLSVVNRATDKAMSGVSKAVEKSQNKFRELTNQVPFLGSALSALKNPILGVTLLLAGMGAAGVDAIKTTRDFQKQVADTAAIAGIQKTDQAYTKLTEKARQLGRDTEFSATQSAKSMEFLARAGFTVEQSIASAEHTLSLATVGNLDLAKSADIASNVMSQYGLNADNAAEQSANLGRVIDVIAKTTTSSNTNVRQFADAMNYLGPTAKALGITIEESSAAIGILGNSGLQGTLATRALGTSLVNLTKPTAKAAREIQKIGLEAFDTEGKFVGLSGLISQLETAYSGYTQEQTQASLATIFGAEAIQELNILLSAGSSELTKYTSQIEKAGSQQGAFAQKIRETKLDTFDGAVKILRSSFQDLQIEIGSRILPTLTSFARELTDTIRSVTKFVQTSETIKAIGAAFVAIKSSLTPVVVAIGNVIRAVAGLVLELTGGLFGALSGAGSIFATLASGAVSVFALAINGVATGISTLAAIVRAIFAVLKQFEGVIYTVTAAIAANVIVAKGLSAAYVIGRTVSLSFATVQALLSGNVLRANAAMKLLGLSTRVTSAVMAIASTATKIFSSVTSVAALKTNLVTVAQKALNLVLKANPIILVISLVAGLIAALVRWERQTGKVSAAFSGSMAFIKTIFKNFASGFVLIAAGLSETFAGIFNLDFDRVEAGVKALGKGIRLQTIDIAKGASDAFNEAYNKRISEHLSKSSGDIPKSIEEIGVVAHEASKKTGATLGNTFGNSFTFAVSNQIANGKGVLDAINGQINLSNEALKTLKDGISQVTASVDGQKIAAKLQSDIKTKLSEGLISPSQASDLARQIEARLKPVTEGAAKVAADSLKVLEDRLKTFETKLSTISPNETAFAKINNQADELRERIASIKLLQLEMSLGSVPNLKSKIDALNESMLRTAPGPGYDILVNKLQEANKELASVKLAGLDDQIQSFDVLQNKLQVLRTLSNQLGPTDPQFRSVLNEVEQVKVAIQKIENKKILIEAGLNIDPNQISISAIKIPPVELAAELKIETNVPQVISPINELRSAAKGLGFSFDYVNRNFRDTNELMRVTSSDAFAFMAALGATSDQAAQFALDLEELKEAVENALVNGVGNAFTAFGRELGKALATGQNATTAFQALFKGLLSVILAEVPKLVGTFLLQTGVGLGFPAGVPFAAAGIGLLAFSGLASGLLSNIGSGRQQVASPDAAQIASQGARSGINAQTGGLSSFSANQENRQTVVNNTIVIETDGIVTELQRQQIVQNENTFGG